MLALKQSRESLLTLAAFCHLGNRAVRRPPHLTRRRDEPVKISHALTPSTASQRPKPSDPIQAVGARVVFYVKPTSTGTRTWYYE